MIENDLDNVGRHEPLEQKVLKSSKKELYDQEYARYLVVVDVTAVVN